MRHLFCSKEFCSFNLLYHKQKCVSEKNELYSLANWKLEKVHKWAHEKNEIDSVYLIQ